MSDPQSDNPQPPESAQERSPAANDARNAPNAPTNAQGEQPASGEPPAPLASDLPSLRQRIDALDERLVALISERGRLAAEIGRLKSRDGTPIYAADRESEILARLSQRNPGPFPDSVLHAIYRELMSGSFHLERPLRIAFLGPRGSFSHLAASGKFGASVEYEPLADIPGVFREVERGHADFGVVPVENSTGGGVVDTLDAFVNTPVKICAEILCAIRHHLLARVPIEQIEKVYSKPEVFDQCRQWLMETGLLGKTVPVASSSRAVELAACEDGTAAIGSALAGELYDLPVLVEHVEDNPDNMTRFFVVGKEPARPTGDDRTALIFATGHHAGALVDVLNVFRQEGVNLTMITSRPSRRRNWEYFFFTVAEGHATDAALVRTLELCRRQTMHLAVLGSFPAAHVVI